MNHLECKCRLKYHSPKLLQLFKAIFLFRAIHDGKDHMYFRESPCILFKLARYARASIICSNTRESMITRRVWLAPCTVYSILWYVWVYVCICTWIRVSPPSPLPLSPSFYIVQALRSHASVYAHTFIRICIYLHVCVCDHCLALVRYRHTVWLRASLYVSISNRGMPSRPVLCSISVEKSNFIVSQIFRVSHLVNIYQTSLTSKKREKEKIFFFNKNRSTILMKNNFIDLTIIYFILKRSSFIDRSKKQLFIYHISNHRNFFPL